MKLASRTTTVCSAVLGSLLLSACGKQPPAVPANPPVAASTTAPAPAATVPTAAGSAAAPATATPAASSTAASAAAPTAAAAVATAPAKAPLTVAKVTLGDAVNAEHRISRPGSSFAASDKTLYASVATEGSSGGATLNAKWSYLEGQGQLVSSVSQSIATDGPAVTTFKVENPDLWPAGKYKVEISLDGKPVATQDFTIRKS